MSRNRSSTMKKFLNCLNLENQSETEFLAHTPDFGWRRIFGGQFIAQGIISAQRTVAKDKTIHSMHCYFLRPGDPETPISYKVSKVRDGASFSMRMVDAYQDERHVFTLQCSFHRFEEGLSHQSQMPSVAPPEKLDLQDMLDKSADQVIRPLKAYIDKERPFEFRPVSTERYLTDAALEPYQSVWLNLVGPLSDEDHAEYDIAMLAYISDALLIDTALFPHSTNIFDGSIQGASLDHALWFHRPFKLDDWVLYHMESPTASGSRGLARGQVFSRDGDLLMSVVQEGLIRKRASAR